MSKVHGILFKSWQYSKNVKENGLFIPHRKLRAAALAEVINKELVSHCTLK